MSFASVCAVSLDAFVVRAMLLCDGVVLLPDWVDSTGAVIEERLARELEMDVAFVDRWMYAAGSQR